MRADALGAPGYTAVSLRGAEIRTQVRLLRTKYDHIIIIDVGGRDTASLRAALTIADTVVVPVLPASFDVWSLEPLRDLIQEAREINGELSVLAMLNAADPQGRDNDEAAAIIRETADLEYFPHPIIRRKAFRNAAAAGLSISECRPADEKAIHEFTLLANYVFGYTAISSQSLMAIAKHRIRQTKAKDKQAEKFIMAASTSTPDAETDGRFTKELLERIDGAAKQRGLNRSSLAALCGYKRTGSRGAISDGARNGCGSG